MPKMTEEELHQKVDMAVKQAVREAVERKRVMQQKAENRNARDAESSTR